MRPHVISQNFHARSGKKHEEHRIMESHPICCCAHAEHKAQNPMRQWKTYKTKTKPQLTITGYSRAADKVSLVC